MSLKLCVAEYMISDSHGTGMRRGWTANIDHADPSYRAPDAPEPIPFGELVTWTGDGDIKRPTAQQVPADPPQPPPTTGEESPTVTEIMSDGSPDVARYSEFMRYPLPPFPQQIDVDLDGFNRYKVPHPETGRITAYSRATTISSVLPESYNLEQWKIRQKVRAVLKAAELKAAADADDSELSDHDMAMVAAFNDLLKAFTEDKAREINRAIDLLDDLAGGADAREFGGAVHDWLGELDMGNVLMHQLPDFVKPFADAYQESLRRAGLVACPQYVERLVLNDRVDDEWVVGRLDRIYRIVETGELVLGDCKTSKSLDFSTLEFLCQLATYGWAQHMLKLDRSGWEPMPQIRDDYAVVVHVPSTAPEHSQVIPYDLWAGAEAYMEAIKVRKLRKELPKRAHTHTTPIPSKESLRYVEARQALQNIRGIEDARDIAEQYEDVWTDDLTEFGRRCVELASPENTN